MIDSQKLPALRDHLELVGNQVDLLAQKISKSPDLDSRENTREEERARVLADLDAYKKRVPKILKIVEPVAKNIPPPPERLDILLEVDDILFAVKRGVEALAREHDECNLDLHMREVVKAVELCRESFDWVLPQIRNEIVFLEKFYGDPLNAQETVIPEVEALLAKLEDHHISIGEFLNGFEEGKQTYPGFRELRIRSDVFSAYQFYDHSFETYRNINTCHYEICTAMESLLKEWKIEKNFDYFLERLRRESRPIIKMGNIFDEAQFLGQFYRQAARKFAFTEEMKRVKPLMKEFKKLCKQLVIYDQKACAQKVEELDQQYKGHVDQKRYQVILDRVQNGIDRKSISFDSLELIFSRLEQVDFNIVVEADEEKAPQISITPYHEKVYGRDLLDRVNMILQEIEFWYPPKMKESLLPGLFDVTRKLQDDTLEDRNSYFKRMQSFDKEIEQRLRHSYDEKIREALMIVTSFQKLFSNKQTQDRLVDRLANQNIWNEITPRIQMIQAELSAANSQNGSKNIVEKFPHLKNGMDELGQLLYDLAMQMFVLFAGAEDQYVANMANILSVCHECHDLPTLWATFSHYHKKIAIPNFPVNETMIMETTKNPFCKSRFKELTAQED